MRALTQLQVHYPVATRNYSSYRTPESVELDLPGKILNHMDWKSTLNLPDANFTIPMKADLATREPDILAKWNESKIYHKLQESRKDAPVFLLHDGPPYTNGPIHIGTGLNKILKDFVLKSRSMMGFRVPYVPGYDNHGLPIEQAVMKAFHEKKETPDIPTLRKACREHASKYIDLQTEQFMRLGIFGLWEKPYKTMDYRFEASIVRVFKRLVQADQVYRGLKPVMWSPTSRTALADTEIEYHDHVSKSIYVRFPLQLDLNGWAEGIPNVFCIIWTTTPWTIPANLGVAFHPNLEYAVVKSGEDHYVVLKDLLEKTMEVCGITDYEVLKYVLGVSFERSEFKHPIFDRTSLAMLADYVTTEDGTGIVHTAPGHGREDFMTGSKYGLPVLCPVDERGVLTEEAGEFAGVSYKDCDTVVVDRLRELGMLLNVSDYHHTYPYAERDGKPVIYRATEQWFVSIDDNDLRTKALQGIEDTTWFPSNGKNRINAMISGRPDWCISRQRPWGVGIPIFYGAESGVPVMDPVAMECVAKIVEEGGSDAWYVKTPAEILPAGYVHPVTGETEFRKEVDVFDVWFDSGSSHMAVMEGIVEPEWEEHLPVDLYLEGSDQHRGWFNVSLLLGTALLGHAPYKAVVTHGFVNDEKGQKMAKRLGNVIDPLTVSNSMGADVLRYWASSVNYEDDMPCGENILKVSGEGYRTIRNTFRFLLGNLHEYTAGAEPETKLDVDEWIVEQTELLCAEAVENYKIYEFRKVLTAINDFCTRELSAVYLDAIKDRMYCDAKDSDTRLSGQWACHQVLLRLVKLCAPILPFTCEETFDRMPGSNGESVHLGTFIVPSEERLLQIEASEVQVRFARLISYRAEIFALLDEWRKGGEVKNNQEVLIDLTDSEENIAFLNVFTPANLANYFKVSWLNLSVGERKVEFSKTPYPQCVRSKVYRPDVTEVQGHMLSERDRKVVGW
jgi:isoleucyl-tRNA synthetase